MAADLIDLTTLALVKDYSEIDPDNTDGDALVQGLITSFSEWVLHKTGIASFTEVVRYVENRDGNGNNRMMLRNPPAVNVATIVVTIDGVDVPYSATFGQPGFFVSDDGRSIVLRSPGQGYSPAQMNYVGRVFNRGVGNVRLSYQGGFESVPTDLEMAVRRTVSIYLQRRDYKDQASKALAAGGTTGTTRFRDWELAPEDACVIDYYSRQSVI